jgi:IstB-like ATP binding protein
MEKTFGAQRLEAACRRGIGIGAASYRSIASILKTSLDKAFRPDATLDADPIQHGNIRGHGYYHWPGNRSLTALGLAGMAKAFDDQQRQPDATALTFERRLMIDREATERENKQLVVRLKSASLRQAAIVEGVDLRAPRGIDRAFMHPQGHVGLLHLLSDSETVAVNPTLHKISEIDL